MADSEQIPKNIKMALKLPRQLFRISFAITTVFIVAFIISDKNAFVAEYMFYTAFTDLCASFILFLLLFIYGLIYREYFLEILIRASILLLYIPVMVLYIYIAISDILIDYHG